ncbi:hypothetical protein AAHE18_15G213600 [Arachis hypogaea]
MALDGSFSVQASLQRFLDRCPKLESLPKFDSLAQKGQLITEDEVVDMLVGVFLHPNYTIPLMGCFRPIARNFVDKAIALLRLVPNLSSNAADTVLENEVLDEVVDVIEFYSKRKRGLDLHEHACLAFCRAFDMFPFLLSSILRYFDFAPPPFQRLLGKQVKVEIHALCVYRISYRLLLVEPDFFSKCWDWSYFLSLKKETKSPDLTWCAVQILGVLLKLGYKATESLSVGAEEAFACLLRWEEFCHDTSLEKASWYIEPVPDSVSVSPNKSTDFNGESCSQSFGFNSLSVSSPKRHELPPPFKSQRVVKGAGISGSNTFILTSSLKKSYERILLAVSQKWPVLLYGPSGSGKSAFIAKLAQDSGNRVLSIQMDDQIDGRTLVGSYVCADRPGEFRWQPGSLTQAVQSGRWIVFEDIDRAPSDVQAILMPLLEGAASFMTGHGEVIRVAESFRMFSTVSVSNFDNAGQLSVLWRRVMIRPPDNEDLREIVKLKYPSLELQVDKITETFERVNSFSQLIAGFHAGTSASGDGDKRFSLRDLLKWCNRIVGLGFCFDSSLSEYQLYCVYREAVDVFATYSTSVKNRLSIMKEIAKLWRVPVSAAETLYPHDKPIIQDSVTDLSIGRVSLQYTKKPLRENIRPLVEIRSSLHALERIACSVKHNEPVLLVGETGTGKTTLVQNLAVRLGQKLTVLNMSQQSDVADLLGGFKPVDAQFVYFPLYNEFVDLFSRTFSKKSNKDLLSRLEVFLIDKNWEMLLKGIRSVSKSVQLRITAPSEKRKKLNEEQIQAWERFSTKLDRVCESNSSSGMMFSFVEGSFVTALRNGEWILLDELNLAPPETLQRIIGVLEGENGALCLAERGDVDYVNRHPKFRIFACMNPATDIGKRDLPRSLRSRFTEYFVDDVLDDDDLSLFVSQYISIGNKGQKLVNKIVSFYKSAKKDSEERLLDGADQSPQFSLRSLYRALEYTRIAERRFGFQKALYDGFSMFFLTLLDVRSTEIMRQKISSLLLGGHIPPDDTYLTFKSESDYILTKSVKEHLRNLDRAVLIKRYPVLLQGPTSSGKTSLVRYLAALTGHEFVRINNHEHTDLQDYLGSYITDTSGKLVFNEGVLVKAVRNGYWIVLDELNLAPSDVLEALNRLLDDNRELFVPELQVTIKAHPDFMLFATQNPPSYNGRKILSRAFRNRFVEIHVGEIPDDELSTIVANKCKIPDSRAKKMVGVMHGLQTQGSSKKDYKQFAVRHGFVTPRDLFRWADRYRKFCVSTDDLAKDGYYLLAERLRDEDEKSVVREVLEKHLGVKLNINNLYDQIPPGGNNYSNLDVVKGGSEILHSVFLTKSMQKLFFLVERCFQLREPVLLVGETGGGKTTVCQLLSAYLQLKLHILNCHKHTETSDFIGGFRPLRERSRLISNYKEIVEQLKKLEGFRYFPEEPLVSSDIEQAASTLDLLNGMIRKYKEGQIQIPDVSREDLCAFEQLKFELDVLHKKWQSIFEWQDGPLVKAMRGGDLFLVDEISLADDSVLERLNSVLEPERTLSLAEKGGSNMEKVTAHSNFFVLATMNPGGDVGKKELSPALRNRFTEIWVPPVSDLNELEGIALRRISKLKNAGNIKEDYRERLLEVVNAMISFFEWFNQIHPSRRLTVRDLISWVDFLDVMEETLGPKYALLHGIFLVLLDGLSLGTGISERYSKELRERCLSFLLQKLRVDEGNLLHSKLSRMESYGWGEFASTSNILHIDNSQIDALFGIDPFYIKKGSGHCEDGYFDFKAPTTRKNAFRVLRAMQLSKPVLLEGSPGVGKTSLIMALGKCSGNRVVRINLSEQTDMMDLLGSDLPVESDEGRMFSWSDGILLQALREGCWVLLDELNLAPQPVLEGLNAILDHRAEVFIPELGNTYKCPPSFRVFACQNPSHQGGGRKSLPRSFLNRFTKVYVDQLVEDDYLSICESKYPTIPTPLLSKLILFNQRMHEETMLHHKFAKDGLPWEFNLRDVFRSCEVIEGSPKQMGEYSFLNIVYIQRMRSAADRKEVLRLFTEVFGVMPFINPYPHVKLDSSHLIVGNATVKRSQVQLSVPNKSKLLILPEICQSLEAIAQCVERQWLCILIGPSSSGKTSLIRLLANLTSNVLNEINLSSATDISELLGSFEQYDALRNFHCIVVQVGHFFNEYSNLQLEASKELIFRHRDLCRRWTTFLSSLNFDSLAASASNYFENWKQVVCSLSLLAEIIEQLKLNLEKNPLPVSYSTKDLDLVLKTILKLKADDQKRLISTKFEWVTGLLIKAIERGEWIVLDNANLCNPTVLDRINSLVEPSGSIVVNERGIVDGNPYVVHPHPNFRLFLTVNPHYGEVSRAMRNRGVEIFMMQPYWALNDTGGYNCENEELKDVKRFLVLSGIPVAPIVDYMARAHIYAKKEGSEINVRITYLELSHWIHLFQQLLMNGCHPIWSLQISWEHTYISSFGDVKGEKIINFAKTAFLSESNLCGYGCYPDSPLGLPGGWQVPLRLVDYTCYSREACTKQDCMYLEFLGRQFAAQQYQNARKKYSTASPQTSLACWNHYFVDIKTLQEIMFPKSSKVFFAKYEKETEIDLEMTNKMLSFAASWTFEQATENDFKYYLLWFNWFGSQLQPFCQFFHDFIKLMKKMMEHPIWKYIAWRDPLDFGLQSIPMLSFDLVDLVASNSQINYICNAIRCIDPLRLTLQQQYSESEHSFTDGARCFVPLLKSLHVLEDEFLNKLVTSSPKLIECSTFDYFIQSYTNLIEDHVLFWQHLISSKFDLLLISWHSLVKDAGKLMNICPEMVENFLMESKNLEGYSFPEKSLLWIYGGHPFLPSSSALHDKQQQLLNFVERFWPRKTASANQESGHLLDVVASFDQDLRFGVMEAVSMSPFIMEKWGHDGDDLQIVKQLEEMYQMLLRRFEHEKKKLQMNTGHRDSSSVVESSASCCSFTPEMLCQMSGFESLQDTFPPLDYTSLFWDMELLQELTSIHWDDFKGEDRIMDYLTINLDNALKFSLRLSSIPPQMFSPQRKILWILSEWTSVDAGIKKIASFILEMWFTWHESLWICFPDFIKNFSKVEGFDVSSVAIPPILLQPVNASTVFHITKNTHAIKELPVQCHKFRVTMSNLWRCSCHGPDLPSFLLLAARALFQQIVYAHKKSFDVDQFEGLKSSFCSLENNAVTEEGINLVSTLIASSSHHRLKNSVPKIIVPLLSELYLQSNSDDFSYSIGCAWVHIGGLRIHLLLSSYNVDPAIKYSCKYSHIEEMVSSLELEIQVRKECGYLSGQFFTREADKRKAERLEKLQAEHMKLQRKIVFRPEPWKYKKLMNECHEFLKQLALLEDLKSSIKVKEFQQVADRARNWQETATHFIDRLTDEYVCFNDIIQPIQVAVYEIKFGLSLILSSSLEKEYLARLGLENIILDMEMLYTIMRFPRATSRKFISLRNDIRHDMHLSYTLDFGKGFYSLDIALMERLMCLSSGIAANMKVSSLQYRASVYQNILVQLAHSIAHAKVMDVKTYMLLHKIFDEFATLWMGMKVHAKSKSDYESQQYKFKPRAFQIESVIEVDMPTLAKLSATETFSEWEQFSSEEKPNDTTEQSMECEILDEEWKELEESIVSNVVLIHNQLFGSSDLVQTSGSFKVSNEDWLHSFSDSYSLGIDLMKGIHSSILPGLDVKLMPEHLLYLCLDYQRKFISSHKSDTRYNFYKDPNAPEMANMLKVLAPLRREILSVLNEWENHNDLQKISDVIDMLLSLPSNIPLAKAFSGLQFLLHKAQLMQEHGSKFPFPDKLNNIYDLLSSWQKIELGSWPGLLDEVMHGYEHNAGKLWFPLYSILQTSSPSAQSIVQSLEDFIQTSSIGEFGKRLQLLFAFLKQNHISVCLDYDSRSFRIKQLGYLYNIFGFYVQFLPIVLKYIDASKKEIETELKELVKLCRWDDSKSYASIEKLKKSRQKLKKLMQKYTDVLQEPVLLFLNQEAAQRGAKAQSFRGHKLIYDVINKGLLSGAVDLTLFSGENRSLWFEKCGEKLDKALQNLQLKRNVQFLSTKYEDIGSVFRACGVSQDKLHLQGWKDMWNMIENIYDTAVHCGDIWNKEKKSRGKRRALSDLLKLLESSGLSRHKSAYEEDQHKSWWFLEIFGSVDHLLLTNSKLPLITSEDGAKIEDKNVPEESMLIEWKTASEHYFKSVISVLFLQQICLNPHKDITLEQVDRSNSFLNQLIGIQKNQLAAASDFGKQLKCLRECVYTLANLFKVSLDADNSTVDMCSIIPNQFATYKCLWQQKQLFDSLCAVSHEQMLLLRTLEHSHLRTCERACSSASQMIAYIDEFLPSFFKSKESLDRYLIGGTKAVTALTSTTHICIVTQDMEQLLTENFKALNVFNSRLLELWEHDPDRCKVKEILIHQFQEIIEKAKLIEEELTIAKMESSIPVESSAKHSSDGKSCEELNADFDQALASTYKHIATVFQNLCLSSNIPTVEESLVNLGTGELLFQSFVANLSLDMLCDEIFKTVAFGEKLVNHADNKVNSYSCKVGASFRDLHMLMDLLLNFSKELMENFLDMHRSVSVTTHVIATILASLFSEGFGVSNENRDEDGNLKSSEDANGTGMGEGVGLNDVSDQINDEDQLLGSRDQQNEKLNDSKDVPSSNNSGIEMEQDFTADAVSLSEDSGDDEDIDGENDELESEMGPTGPDSEAVDEKFWDKNEDETPNDSNEKYESGPSVRDQDGSTKEMRAKDDATDETGNGNYDEGNAQNDETASQDETGDGDNVEELNMDKETAYSESTGLMPDELNQTSDMDEDLDMGEDAEPMEEGDPEGQGELAENEMQEGDQGEETGPPDEIMEEVHTEVDATTEKEDVGQGQKNAEMDLMDPKKDTSESSGMVNDQIFTAKSSSQSNVDRQTSSSENITAEPEFSNSQHNIDNPALLGGFPSNSMSEMDIKMSDSSNTGGINENRSESHLPQNEHSFIQENQPNPYRSVGDALEHWKERVRVSGDLQENNMEQHGEMDDDNADEYGYVSEFEKGTDQALGPASMEQVDKNVNGDTDKECLAGEKDAAMQIEKKKSEINSLSNSLSFPKTEKREQINMPDIEKAPDEGSYKPVTGQRIDLENRSEDLVSFQKSYLSENTEKLGQLSVHDNDLGKGQDASDDPSCERDAAALWRRYEVSTTKLSMELAEQLRLVMEPTVANKLQGDYRTGKRINMKKVIQFIASYYTKDKIWMRLTRPNKRDYQVVIAVDDSLSMSESSSGDVAIEALVTVCRAISQLELGSFAVASFGTKGNIKLLHDFDRSFSVEAGIKMVSNLTFKQENTIVDEPVLDLLKYLTNKLDSAVVQARLPSGHNPLQQLVLIISDGIFHEKERLRRRVRDLLTSNRLVMFLVLDKSEKSIMDLMEASFEDGTPRFSKYMDSFPFPYYVVLRNIEALPRTLADLLRQWLELMQHLN